MKKTFVVAASALGAALLVPATAGAQEAHGFGSQTQLILSADRLVPVFAWTSATRVTDPNPNDTREETQTDASTSLLWGNDGQGFFGPRSPHTVPRVGFDFVVIPHLTIGGSVALAFSLGGSTEEERRRPGRVDTETVDSPSNTVIGLGPRVGYIIPLGDSFAFWPRGGFSFYSLRRTDERRENDVVTRVTNKATTFSLDIDPQFVIVPLEHFFINVGPLINIPLTGSVGTEVVVGNASREESTDLTLWHFGITAGLGGWFNL